MEKITTLEEDYLEEGQTEAIHVEHQCHNCGKWLPPFALTNVKNNDYWPTADYVCGHCYMDFTRDLNKFVEDMAKAVAPSKAYIKLILKEKRRILNDTLWATATDGTVTQEEREQWLAYRQAISNIDPENFTEWPEEPKI